MNKEQAYDEKISPLMTQIIATCKEHGIAMISSFALPTEQNEDLCCTTCTQDENGKNAFGHAEAIRIIRNERPAMHIRTDHGAGRTTMTAIL